jgi:hypothetical protein
MFPETSIITEDIVDRSPPQHLRFSSSALREQLCARTLIPIDPQKSLSFSDLD